MSKPREKKITAPLQAVISKLKAQAKGAPNERKPETQEIAHQLEARFGVGSQPDLRRRLYQRLQLACEIHGERALKQLKIVAAEAKGAKKPDRYFCRAALCRLREMNLLEMEDFG